MTPREGLLEKDGRLAFSGRAAPQVEIVVPVRNEERDLGPSVRRIEAYLRTRFPFTARITIADNGSSDGTWAVASSLASELDAVRAIRLEQPGRGRALRSVWQASDADVLAYMDVDLSTDLNALLPLVAPLLSGHSDVAIGTRLGRGARVVRGPRREVISRGYNLLLHATLGARFSDAQCGFKAISRARARVLLPLTRDTSWFFDTELLILAQEAGLRIHEVPVDWIDDADSRVNVIATILADLRGIARLGFGLLRGSIAVPFLGDPGSPPQRRAGRRGQEGTGQDGVSKDDSGQDSGRRRLRHQVTAFAAVGAASTSPTCCCTSRCAARCPLSGRTRSACWSPPWPTPPPTGGSRSASAAGPCGPAPGPRAAGLRHRPAAHFGRAGLVACRHAASRSRPGGRGARRGQPAGHAPAIRAVPELGVPQRPERTPAMTSPAVDTTHDPASGRELAGRSPGGPIAGGPVVRRPAPAQAAARPRRAACLGAAAAPRAARRHRLPLPDRPGSQRLGQRLLLGSGAGGQHQLEGILLRLVRRL